MTYSRTPQKIAVTVLAFYTALAAGCATPKGPAGFGAGGAGGAGGAAPAPGPAGPYVGVHYRSGAWQRPSGAAGILGDALEIVPYAELLQKDGDAAAWNKQDGLQGVDWVVGVEGVKARHFPTWIIGFAKSPLRFLRLGVDALEKLVGEGPDWLFVPLSSPLGAVDGLLTGFGAYVVGGTYFGGEDGKSDPKKTHDVERTVAANAVLAGGATLGGLVAGGVIGGNDDKKPAGGGTTGDGIGGDIIGGPAIGGAQQ